MNFLVAMMVRPRGGGGSRLLFPRSLRGFERPVPRILLAAAGVEFATNYELGGQVVFKSTTCAPFPWCNPNDLGRRR